MGSPTAIRGWDYPSSLRGADLHGALGVEQSRSGARANQ